MNKEQIEVVKTFIENGGSVCPIAKKCKVHYVLDTDDLKPTLRSFISEQAVIIVASHTEWLTTFNDIKSWAQATFLKAMRHAARLNNPEVSDKEITKEIVSNIAPILLDDSDQRRPNIVHRDAPIMTICMAPVYPSTHPRYSPIPILVLTWYEDINKAGIFPKVRQIMEKEHGVIYDAIDLILPLPNNKL